jgi:biopolymer transport protein ExbD
VGKPLFALEDDLSEGARGGALLAGINTTPLVDVMLVLLIIFLITIPVVTSAVKLVLPQDRIAASQSRPDSIIISVDRAGQVFWFESPVPDADSLLRRLRDVASRVEQPEVQIRGDHQARFEGVGQVLLACQRAGIAKVSFVTEPAPLN